MNVSRETLLFSIKQRNIAVTPKTGFLGGSTARANWVEGVVTSKRRSQKKASGHITLTCTYNNSYLHFESYRGCLVRKSSAGSLSKGILRKKSAYLSSLLGESFGEQLRKQGISTVDLTIQSFGRGRDGVLSGLRKSGLRFCFVKQRAVQPHNGCRPPKIRRL